MVIDIGKKYRTLALLNNEFDIVSGIVKVVSISGNNVVFSSGLKTFQTNINIFINNIEAITSINGRHKTPIDNVVPEIIIPKDEPIPKPVVPEEPIVPDEPEPDFDDPFGPYGGL